MHPSTTPAFELNHLSPAQLDNIRRAERPFVETVLTTKTGRVRHRKRPTVELSGGVHATWKLVDGLPSMRQRKARAIILECFHQAKQRFDLNLLGYTIMGNHLHLIVGPKADVALSKGMQGLGVRLAKALNRVFGHTGKVFRDRFFARPLMTRSSVRHAVRYALQNARRHGLNFPPGQWDPYSSPWFHKHGNNSTFRTKDQSALPFILADPVEFSMVYVGLRVLSANDRPGPRSWD